MARLSTHGGFDEELLAKAKEEMRGELEFAEQEEPLARNGSGYPTAGGFIEQHFDFATCQRADGSYYGSRGRCIKGSEAKGGAPKKETAAKKSGGGGGPTKADISSKRKEVRKLDKTAKAADKAADKASAAWKKGGAKYGTAEHKKVKELDKAAKEANKRADAKEKELNKMVKAAKKKPKSTNTAGMTLRDAQRQGLTTSGSKNPDWKSVNEARAARGSVKKTSDKDRAKD